jgi:hypothetical protein
MSSDTKYLAFRDELTKISGESRIGRKPIGIEKLLENESEVTGLPEDFTAAPEVVEVAQQAAKALVKMSASVSIKGGHAALLAAGAGGALFARKANEDRKMGRAMRKQQQAQQAY